MDVFDIIGPVMVGPSSSHTAGAVRLGEVARKLLGKKPADARITLYGSFAKTGKGHGTDKAILAGIFGLAMDDAKIKDIYSICDFSYSFTDDENEDYHPNTAKIELTCGNEELSVLGSSIGGGVIEVTQINGLDVSLSGENNTVVLFHHDQKGVIAKATGILSDMGINIAFMRMFRLRAGGDAVCAIEIDGSVADTGAFERVNGVNKVMYYERGARA
jgi:L-serine dehydratase